MEYRELGELNPPFILSPRTLFDYRQAILLFKPAFYPTRSPPPVHQTPPPLSRIFKVGAVHTVITIKPRSRPPSLPYIYPPSRYLGLSGTIKRVCAIAIAIVVAREKGEKKIVDAGKEQKGSAEAFSERAHIQREVRRGCVRAPPSSLSLSLFADPSVLVARSVGEKKRSVRRARRTRGGRGSRKRDRQVGPREEPAAAMVTVAFPPRLVAMETPRGPLSISLSFTSFACPLSVSLVHPESLPVPFPPLFPLTHPSSLRLPSLRVSPRRRAKLLSTSPAHSLIFSPCSLGRRGREGRRDKEERAREIGREKREGKERMRDTPRRLPRRGRLSVSNRSISYRLKVIYVPPLSGPSLAAA